MIQLHVYKITIHNVQNINYKVIKNNNNDSRIIIYIVIITYKFRVNAYIRNGWDKQLIDPDNAKQSVQNEVTSLLPNDGWIDIKKTYLAFTNAQIISYFVTRAADDGLPAADFKSINNSACNLYRCGHVQKIEVCHRFSSNILLIHANCLPEMKKDRLYKLVMQLTGIVLKKPMLSAFVQQDADQKQVVSTLLPCAMLWKRLVD